MPNSPPPPARTLLPRKHYGIVSQTVERWHQCGLVDDATRVRLMDSVAIAGFDWRRAARYSFLVALACLVIALGAILADRILLEMLLRIFQSPPDIKALVLAALAALFFRLGLGLRRKQPRRRYRNEAVLFLGVLALGAAVYFLGAATDGYSGQGPRLVLVAAVLYLLLGFVFPSALVWTLGLLALGTWMGAETAYEHGAYFLGMNYPLRFIPFGALLTGLGIAGERAAGRGSLDPFGDRLAALSPQTKVIGLLNLFIALWILSIFGNYGDMEQWAMVRQFRLLHWALLFGAVAVASTWYGLRRDDGVLRGFGLTFLFINLYTRFFEYGWHQVHKGVFFALLAASFWVLGSRAETIWCMGQQKRGGGSGNGD